LLPMTWHACTRLCALMRMCCLSTTADSSRQRVPRPGSISASARASVMPLEREGGQAQFIAHPPPNPDGSTLAPLLAWMQKHVEQNPTLGQLADQAGLSPRTLIRRFRAQTGTTPAQWLIMARIRRAQHLLETTDTSIERIAGSLGFGAATFRDQFRRRVGVS